jgi:outer membrane immunogenic protein
MSKALIGIAAAVALIGTPALAADMPVKAPSPPPAPVYSWTGFYVGGNAGGFWGHFDPTTTTFFCPGPGCFFNPTTVGQINTLGAPRINGSGFTGGFEIGYNWQASNFVFGFEGDIEAFSLKGSATTGFLTNPGFGAGAGFFLNSSASTTWLATERGRVGFAANNWLIYATGGAAFTNLRASFSYVDNFATGDSEAASLSSTKVGAVVGGGVEWALWRNWSVKTEYLFVNFGSVSTSASLCATAIGACPGANVLTHSVDLKANIARVGLNYQFH